MCLLLIAIALLLYHSKARAAGASKRRMSAMGARAGRPRIATFRMVLTPVHNIAVAVLATQATHPPVESPAPAVGVVRRSKRGSVASLSRPLHPLGFPGS